MPLTKDITFKCPECGEEIPLTLWQSVNTAENPKEAEALAYGDLFYIQCPKCGYQTMANYSLLYHDVEHGMMIQYIATPDREERAKEMAEYRKARKDSIEAAKAQDPALAKQLYGAVFRFVTSLNDLREKALILRAGLDDHYVELVKAYIMPQAANMKPDLGIESVRFFLDKDGKQYLYFFDKDGKEAGSCDFDMESYNAFKNGLSLVEADTDIIDTGWAREVISEIESQDTFQG